VTITACDRSDQLAAGHDRGLIDAGVTEPADLAAAECVVLAVPMAAMGDLIHALGRCRAPGIITDVGSTKRSVMAAAAAAGLRRFVGGHPMAGAEHAGLEHARADLFQDRPWLLVAAEASEARAAVEGLITTLGGRPRWLSAEHHDRTMAYVSHLPQLLATTLMNVAARQVGDDGLSAAGPAFVEMTRLASSPSHLWQGILADNADFTAEALARFVEALPEEAEVGRADWVREAFLRASQARRRWRPSDRLPE
jgi:prephenate dehydrogenase